MVRNKYCVYPGCSRNSRTCDGSVKYFPFPKPARNYIKCDKWLQICQKSCSQNAVTEHWYICYTHFLGGNGPTESSPDPLPVIITAPTDPLPMITTAPTVPTIKDKSQFMDQSQFKALLKKLTSNPSTIYSEDKSLFISNSTYEEFEQQKKSWFENEMDEEMRLNERTNLTNQVSTNSAFIQHLLDLHKNWCLSSQSSKNSNEFNSETCAFVVKSKPEHNVSKIKSEPEDYVDYDDDCDKITPD